MFTIIQKPNYIQKLIYIKRKQLDLDFAEYVYYNLFLLKSLRLHTSVVNVLVKAMFFTS